MRRQKQDFLILASWSRRRERGRWEREGGGEGGDGKVFFAVPVKTSEELKEDQKSAAL